jgi:gentisate 1,2-dioxygenase
MNEPRPPRRPARRLRAGAAQLNLVPLWPSLRAVLPPGQPRRNTQATHWSYQALRPLLMRAGELTPIEKAERRVLVLANPGHGLDNMKASAAMYLGMQLLLPGEWAPAHRHTPNAVRMIVEGEGAYTTVDGEKCPMSRGDLILTPTGLWHEHGHDGTEPVVWLDVLDLPLVYYMEASYHIERPAPGRQAGPRRPRLCARRHGAHAGVRPQRQGLPDAALPLGRGARGAAGAGRRPARPGACRSPTSTPRPAATRRTSSASTR